MTQTQSTRYDIYTTWESGGMQMACREASNARESAIPHYQQRLWLRENPHYHRPQLVVVPRIGAARKLETFDIRAICEEVQ